MSAERGMAVPEASLRPPFNTTALAGVSASGDLVAVVLTTAVAVSVVLVDGVGVVRAGHDWSNVWPESTLLSTSVTVLAADWSAVSTRELADQALPLSGAWHVR